MVVFGTGKSVDWKYPMLLLVLELQTFGVDFSSFQPLWSQPAQQGKNLIVKAT